MATIMTPSTAIAINAAKHATALFTPEADPENLEGTISPLFVNGAITKAIPIPKSASPGRKY
jgi:hypothetical protein